MNGSIINVEDLGKKKLAYKVKGNDYGIYVQIEFSSKYETIAELEKKYRSIDEILKYFIIRKEEY